MIFAIPGPQLILLLFCALFVTVLGVSIAAREHFSRTSLKLLLAIAPTLLSMFSLAYLLALPEQRQTPDQIIFLGRLMVAGYYLTIPAIFLLITSIFHQFSYQKLTLAIMGVTGIFFALLTLGTNLIVTGIRAYYFGLFPELSLLGYPFFLLSYPYFIMILYRYWENFPASPKFIPKRRKWFFSILAFSLLIPYDLLIMAGIPLIPLGYLFATAFFITAAAGIWRFKLMDITPSLAAEEILAAMGDPLLVCDLNNRIRITNRSFETTFIFAEDTILGMSVDSVMQCREEMSLSQLLVAGTTREIHVRSGRGEWIPVSLTVSNLSEDNRFDLGKVLVLRDIRPFKEAEADLEKRVKERTQNLLEANAALEREIREREKIETELRISREGYQLIAQGTNDGIWDWDLREDTVYYSPRWKKIVGLPTEKRIWTPEAWLERVHPDDRQRVESEIKEHLQGNNDSFSSEHRLAHCDGEYRWIQCRGLAARTTQGRAYRFAGSISDITRRKTYEHQLIHEAYHDTLTGLPNRSALIDRLTVVFSKYKRDHRHSFAVLFMDLDRFKVINDSLGHQIGDEILVQSSTRLSSCCRSADTVARIGGDEFVVLLEDISGLGEVVAAAERIRDEMNRSFPIATGKIYSGVSIGIALANEAYTSVDQILRDADTAMYRAKAQGKSRYAVFNEQMHDAALSRMEIERDLRIALERNELELYYQPILDLESSGIIEFEALIRWNHPAQGLLMPDSFIPVAEESDLILSVGSWVLREAARTVAEWRERFSLENPVKISINIAVRQLLDEGLVPLIEKVLQETRIPPDSLSLEISEKSIITDVDSAFSALSHLKGMGIEIHMDDFGEGFSSMSLLHKLPMDTMKIDKSFITGKMKEDKERELVGAIIKLGHNMKKKIIAEGIEDREEAEILRAFNCELGQGYFFSRPLPKAEAERYIAETVAG